MCFILASSKIIYVHGIAFVHFPPSTETAISAVLIFLFVVKYFLHAIVLHAAFVSVHFYGCGGLF